MLGGIDKRILTADKKETDIENELEKVKAILKTGGYIPHMDHHIPDDAPAGYPGGQPGGIFPGPSGQPLSGRKSRQVYAGGGDGTYLTLNQFRKFDNIFIWNHKWEMERTSD